MSNQLSGLWLIGFPNLILTVVSSASILPLTINIQIENSYLKLLWRNITMVPFLILLSVIEVWYFRRQQQGTTFKNIDFQSLLRMINEAKVDLFNCGLSLLAMQVTYLLSGYYTVMAHATLFTNLTPFMLVILRFFMR